MASFFYLDSLIDLSVEVSVFLHFKFNFCILRIQGTLAPSNLKIEVVIIV